MTRTGLRVAVVGGSIAGCAVTTELRNAGHRVSVHERAAGALSDHGIGIGVEAATMARLIDRGLIDADIAREDARIARYVHRGADGEVCRIGDVAMPAAMFHWSDLHAGLRRQVPDEAYHGGQTITVGDGRLGDPDLVVFADGYRSIGRGVVAPDATRAYQGLVMWRGVVPEADSDVDDIVGTRNRIVYPGGHGVAYLMPGPGGTTAVGTRQVMWGYYLPVPLDDLGAVLTDRDGRRHGGSVALGRTADGVAAALRDRLDPLLPRVFLDMIDRTAATAIQAIFAVDVERTHRDRACLIGDAASVFPPYSGSGVLKAIDDAVSLRTSLDDALTVDAALGAWSETQRRTTETVRALTERNASALVWDVPDLAAMREDEKSRWLSALHGDAVVSSLTAS